MRNANRRRLRCTTLPRTMASALAWCARGLAAGALSVWPLAASASGESARAPASPHPAVAELIADGMDVGGGQRVTLPPPLVTPRMTAAEQREAIIGLVGAGDFDRFARDSVSAKHRTRVATGRSISGGDTIRRMDQHFIAHGDLALIRDEQLMNSFMAAEEQRGAGRRRRPRRFTQYFSRIEPPADAPMRLVEGLNDPSIYKMRYPVLGDVVVSGLMRGQTYSGGGVLIQLAHSATGLLNDRREPTVWRAIPDGAESDADLGPPRPYRGFAGYVQLTELKCVPGAVLVETHGVLVEPEGWFGGRNKLASKLPILAQQNVRDFRRQIDRLKEAATGRRPQGAPR